jgi:hypothetical protein
MFALHLGVVQCTCIPSYMANIAMQQEFRREFVAVETIKSFQAIMYVNKDITSCMHAPHVGAEDELHKAETTIQQLRAVNRDTSSPSR